jgi:hypothetical protein
MKKSILFILISCFVMISANMVQAQLPNLPITPSTDTGSGAHWYRIKNHRNVGAGYAAYLKATNTTSNATQEFPDNSDNFLWCFVGDNTTGFQIYNKAFLTDGARLITNGSGVYAGIRVATSATQWNYSWTFAYGSFYTLRPSDIFDGDGTTPLYLHGQLNTTPTIFYVLSDPGSAWDFEDGSIHIGVDFSLLTDFISTCTTQINADKGDSQKATIYANAISIYDAAIATAQAVVNNSASTQANVTTAINTLKIARTNYALAFVALPFTLSQGSTMVWYKIINNRRDTQLGGTGYLTYDNSALSQTAATGSDNQLWAFSGNNTTGINILNKANVTDGAKLINTGSFTISNATWSGAWKIDTSNGLYGICNANGQYNTAFYPDNFFHGLNTAGATGGIVYYGIGDSGSLWRFAAAPTGGTTSLDKNNVSKISVFSHDGIISVIGARGMATIVTMTGATATFDTQKPYNVGGKGIYIVRVNGEVLKVMVK